MGSRRRDWLVHTFCGQACGHLAHSIRKPLIRRYKHRRINQAARGNAGDETALQAPTAARRGARFSRSSRVAASAHRRFSACFQPRRSRRLFHNFCWQACGHPEHPPSNTLIRRHFPKTVRNAASRLKSVRCAPHGRRPPPNRPAASPRRQSSTTHFRRGSFPQFLCANLWISRAAARQAIDPSELFAILVPAARRLAQASAMRSGARAARASAYTGACRHRRTCPCRRRAARRRQSG